MDIVATLRNIQSERSPWEVILSVTCAEMLVVRTLANKLHLQALSCSFLPSDPNHSVSGKQLVYNLECLNLRLPCINDIPEIIHFSLV